MNIRIIKADVVKSADAMEDIADSLAKLDFGAPLEKVASAMPGGESAGGVKSLTAEWTKGVKGVGQVCAWPPQGVESRCRQPREGR